MTDEHPKPTRSQALLATLAILGGCFPLSHGPTPEVRPRPAEPNRGPLYLRALPAKPKRAPKVAVVRDPDERRERKRARKAARRKRRAAGLR